VFLNPATNIEQGNLETIRWEDFSYTHSLSSHTHIPKPKWSFRRGAGIKRAVGLSTTGEILERKNHS
jgi:hypothetical protein